MSNKRGQRGELLRFAEGPERKRKSDPAQRIPIPAESRSGSRQYRSFVFFFFSAIMIFLKNCSFCLR